MSSWKTSDRDYLVYSTKVHVMRFMGRNDDGNLYWRIACGSRHSQETWECSIGVNEHDVIRMDLSTCKTCFRV